MISLVPTSDQMLVADAIGSFLARNAPLDRLRQATNGTDPVAFPQLGELGLLAVMCSEDAGGQGAVEQALAFFEAGKVLLTPTAASTALAAALSEIAGDAALNQALTTGAAVVPFVLPGPDASAYVLGPAPDGLGLLLREQRLELLDLRGLVADDCLDESVAGGRADLGSSPRRLAAESPALLNGAALVLAAMLSGLAEIAKALATEYAKVRVQFGQPIGAFQAVKHRCADMAVAAEGAWRQTSYAAVGLAAGYPSVEFHLQAALAKSLSAATVNAASCVQVHGGMGFTADCHAHRLVKRARLLSILAENSLLDRARLMGEAPPAWPP